jgi:hypothetical protein
MTYEQIETIVQTKNAPGVVYEIKFKTRNSIKGLFIQTADYRELSRKNLWRIVSETHIKEYQASRNTNLARIFNGVEITKLELSR